MSTVLPLLIPTSNQMEGFGEFRDCWTLNFNYQDQRLFEFFGILVGYAIRSTSALPLNLHPIVWKQINGTKLTEEDIKTSDVRNYILLDNLRTADEEYFNTPNLDELTFIVRLSDGSDKELIDNGSNIKVTYENRLQYVKLATEALLNVASK